LHRLAMANGQQPLTQNRNTAQLQR
jgi:hypothetical protein